MDLVYRINERQGLIVNGPGAGTTINVVNWARFIKLQGDLYRATWPDEGAYFTARFGWPTSYFRLNGQEYSSFTNIPGATSTGGAGFGTVQRNGVWQSVAANAPLIGDGGLGVYEARTNKCANYNANPTDGTGLVPGTNVTLSYPTDAAALSAAGLSGLTSTVVRVVNADPSLERRVIISGATGNTNTHTAQVWMRAEAGSARLGLVGSSGVTIGSLVSSSAYTRVSGSFAPSSSGDGIAVYLAPNSVVYFTLNQLEEGSFATAPIVVQGLAATRTAVAQSVGGLVLPSAFEVRGRFRIVAAPDAGTFRRVFSVNDGGTTNTADVYINGSRNIRLFARSNGTIVAEGGPATQLEIGRYYDLIARYQADAFSMYLDGVQVFEDATGPMPVGLNRLQFGNNSEMIAQRTLNGEIANLSIREAA